MDRYDAFTAMDRIGKASAALCRPDSLEAIWQGPEKGEPMPSLDDLKEIMDRLSVALFPGFFGSARIWKESMEYHVSANLDSIYRKLSEQIRRGLCFSCKTGESCADCRGRGRDAALRLIDALPEIRRLLAGDSRLRPAGLRRRLQGLVRGPGGDVPGDDPAGRAGIH